MTEETKITIAMIMVLFSLTMIVIQVSGISRARKSYELNKAVINFYQASITMNYGQVLGTRAWLIENEKYIEPRYSNTLHELLVAREKILELYEKSNQTMGLVKGKIA